MHAMFMEYAVGSEGEGTPAKLVVNHKCEDIDVETGLIRFSNGVTAQHDVVIGADGIGSATRRIIGVNPDKRPAATSCLHANVDTETAVKLGFPDYSKNNAIEYWG